MSYVKLWDLNLPTYVRQLRDNEAEVRIAAAGKVTKFSRILSPEHAIQHIIPCVKVVDALCNVVSASPTIVATAIVLQESERELLPWIVIAKDDDLGQKMWKINQRIVKLMRNHETTESLVILSSALDLLLRATDGMLVDGEACTLPQLEVLEATARAVHPVLEWGGSGLAVADGLLNLLKCRLAATVRCLSHPSAPQHICS